MTAKNIFPMLSQMFYILLSERWKVKWIKNQNSEKGEEGQIQEIPSFEISKISLCYN
jgi:hypothetical protein